MHEGFKRQLTVRITGRNTERFITGALREGIPVRTVKSGTHAEGMRSLLITINASDFKKLRPLVRKYRCRIHIVRRTGLHFRLDSYRTRPVLLFGWILSVIALAVISSRIWVIEVNGCQRTDSEAIVQKLSDLGIHTGSAFNGDSTGDIKAALLEDGDIAWVDVTLHGVRLSVDIVESTDAQSIESNGSSLNIYASEDGIITDIAVYSGHAAVAVGDAVKRGDILITGDLSTEEQIVMTVPRGEVRARILRRFTYTEGPTVIKHISTENTYERTRISFFGFEFKRDEYDEFEIDEQSANTLYGCFLPIKFTSELCRETHEAECDADINELKTLASCEAESLMLNGLSHDARIISKSTDINENGDGSVTCTISVTVEESIVP